MYGKSVGCSESVKKRLKSLKATFVSASISIMFFIAFAIWHMDCLLFGGAAMLITAIAALRFELHWYNTLQRIEQTITQQTQSRGEEYE